MIFSVFIFSWLETSTRYIKQLNWYSLYKAFFFSIRNGANYCWQCINEQIFTGQIFIISGYFIVNEILKTFPEKPLWPHWTIAPMMSNFLNSFRPTAQMVSSTLKHRMRPIVEQTGKAHQISSWKIDPSTLKFLLKGTITYDKILPYSKELVEPQRDLLVYILRQLSSKELVNR